MFRIFLRALKAGLYRTRANTYVDKLTEAFAQIESAIDQTQRIAACSKFLDLEGQDNSWPFEQPTRIQARGTVFAIRGSAYALRSRRENASDLEQSIADFKAALEIYSRVGFELERAEIYRELAIAYQCRVEGDSSQNLDLAIRTFELALDYFSLESEPTIVAGINLSLGFAYTQRASGDRNQNLERALNCLDIATQVFVKSQYAYEWAQAQTNIAIVYRHLPGDKATNIERAIERLDLAVEVFSSLNRAEDWAQAHFNRSNMFMLRTFGPKQKNLDEAFRSISGALQVFTRERSPTNWAQCMILRTNLLVAMKYTHEIFDPSAPDENLNSIIENSSEDTNAQVRAGAHISRGLAFLYGTSGVPESNIEAAIAEFDAALEISKLANLPREWALSQEYRAIAFLVRIVGNRPDNLNEAFSAITAALELIEVDTDTEHRLFALQIKGAVSSAAKSWKEALDTYHRAQQILEQMIEEDLRTTELERVLEATRGLGPEMALAAVQLGRPIDALRYLESGRARLLAIGLRRNVARDALPKKLRSEFDARLTALKGTQADLSSASAEARPSILAALTAARASFDEVLKEGKALSSVGELSFDQNLRNLRRSGIVLAAPVFTREGAVVIVCGPTGSVEAIAPRNFSIEAVSMLTYTGGDCWLAVYRSVLMNDSSLFKSRLESISDQLWSLFVGDLVAALDERGVMPGSRLALAPQGMLGLLPLGLARNPVSGERLMDRYELMLAPSISTLYEKAEPTQVSLAAVFDPTGVLPAATAEAKVVAGTFGGQVVWIAGANANLTTVLNSLDGKSHWHFACHGTFDWHDARKSGLKLSNGDTLTLGELERSTALTPPRLVVLSACESGLHDFFRLPEEFIGLPAGFLERGAGAVLATLWPVNDTSTALLIYKFYEIHIREGQRPAAALKAAQAWLRELTYIEVIELSQALNIQLPEHMNDRPETTRRVGAANSKPATQNPKPFEHPYYWAGFTVYGL